MTRIMTATTSTSWISAPPKWPVNPRRQRIKRTKKKVQSICFFTVSCFSLSGRFPEIELERPASGDELDNQHYDRRQQNQVNEIPDGINVDESEQSQNQQYDKDG